MEAYAAKDDQGSFILTDGYLSFICRENGNIIRIDPSQFDFSGSEPFFMQDEDVEYNLFLNKKCDTENLDTKDDHEYCFVEDVVTVNFDEMEEISATERKDIKPTLLVTPTVKIEWSDESTKLLLDLYKEISPEIGVSPKFKTKRKVWEKISEVLQCHGYNYTSAQVENKWKNLERSRRLKLERLIQGKKIRVAPYDRKLAEVVLTQDGRITLLSKKDAKPTLNELVSKIAPVSIKVSESESPVIIKPLIQHHPTSTTIQLSSGKSVKSEWDKTSTEMLIKVYQEMSPQLGKTPQCRNEDKLWEAISERLDSLGHHFLPQQVKKRCETFESLLKPIRDKNIEKESKANIGEFSKKSITEEGVVIEEVHTIAVDESTCLESEVDADLNNKRWTEESTEILMNLFKEHSPQQGINLRYKTMADMWNQISLGLKSHGYNFTPSEVEIKWKTINKDTEEKNRNNSSVEDSEAPLYILADSGQTEEELVTFTYEEPIEGEQVYEQTEEETVPELMPQESTGEEKLSDDNSQGDQTTTDGHPRYNYIGKIEWTEEATELLIDIYRELNPHQGATMYRKYASRKEMWERISEELKSWGHHFTPAQVENRWKTLERRIRIKVRKLKEQRFLKQASHPMKYRKILPKRPENEVIIVKPVRIMDKTHEVKGTKQEDTKPAQGSPVKTESLERTIDSSPSHVPKKIKPTSAITDCLNKLAAVKEKYYKEKLEMKKLKLKAFVERTAEMKTTNELLQQFLMT